MLTNDRVADLMIEVADSIVVPRFNALSDADVAEKSPGDYVTIADQLSEAALIAQLESWFPHALVLGEERIAADPALASDIDATIDTAEDLWLVDPVDGTGNFVSGNPNFGLMVVHLRHGQPQESWIWQAMARRMFHATTSGAWANGVPLQKPQPAAPIVGGVTPEYAHLQAPGLDVRRMTGSCTFDYPEMATGRRGFLIHNGRYPWDHYPGVLLLTQLGGKVAFMDGEPYSAQSRNQHKIVAATSPELWQRVADAALPLTPLSPE